MKKLMVALTAMILGVVAYSQVSQSVATLYHEGELSSYYGMNALIDAYNAAADGDIITLSSGSFTACDIEKSLTIRGAGCDPDSIYNGMPTYILGELILAEGDNSNYIINIEGIYTKHKIRIGANLNLTFNRCRLHLIDFTSYNIIATFINCRICNNLYIGYVDEAKIEFYNCICKGFCFWGNGTCSVYNCIFSTFSREGDFSQRTFVTNSIILGGNATFSNENCTLTNNVSFGDTNYFDGFAESNKMLPADKMAEVFESFSADCSDDTSTYRLKNKEGFTVTTAEGTDEIGLYGGVMPWGTVPHNPQITKFQVDKKSSATGKLNVTIEVGN